MLPHFFRKGDVDLQSFVAGAEAVLITATIDGPRELDWKQQDGRVERDVRAVILVPLHETKDEKERVQSSFAGMAAVSFPDRFQALVELIARQQYADFVVLMMHSNIVIVARLEVIGRVEAVSDCQRLDVEHLAIVQNWQSQLAPHVG